MQSKWSVPVRIHLSTAIGLMVALGAYIGIDIALYKSELLSFPILRLEFLLLVPILGICEFIGRRRRASIETKDQ